MELTTITLICQIDISKAKAILLEKHSEETLLCLKRLSDEYKSKVFHVIRTCCVNFRSRRNSKHITFCQFFIFSQTSDHEFKVEHKGFSLTINCNSAQEAAKQLGVYLYHKGCLSPYEKGSASQVITVHSLSVNVKFNTWFHMKSSGKVDIIVESFYVKVVCMQMIN